jgi:hypothetical protein
MVAGKCIRMQLHLLLDSVNCLSVVSRLRVKKLASMARIRGNYLVSRGIEHLWLSNFALVQPVQLYASDTPLPPLLPHC